MKTEKMVVHQRNVVRLINIIYMWQHSLYVFLPRLYVDFCSMITVNWQLSCQHPRQDVFWEAGSHRHIIWIQLGAGNPQGAVDVRSELD